MYVIWISDMPSSTCILLEKIRFHLPGFQSTKCAKRSILVVGFDSGSPDVILGNVSKSFLSSRVIEKACGIGFLILYMKFISILGIHTSVQTFTSPFQAYLVSGFSLCNVISHTAVVMNLLNDGLLISILLGVSFDVVSCVVYFWSIRNNPLNISLMIWTSGTFSLHLRALLLSTSLNRASAVVTSAVNNLRGIPGPWLSDHLFAYTDLGLHMSFFILAIRETIGKGSTSKAIGLAISFIAPLILLFRQFLAPLPNSHPKSNADGTYRQPPIAQLHVLHNKARPVCDCKVCRQQTAFSVAPPYLCELWYCNFEELLVKIEQAQKHSSSQ